VLDFFAETTVTVEVLRKESYAMFVQLLNSRQCGQDPPWTFPRLFQHQRYAEVEVSTTKEFARVKRSGITTLDIDDQEGR